MDTRSKILRWPDDADILQRKTVGGSACMVVVGYFDPVLAAHARRLSEIANGGKVIAVISSPARPLLPARARAELVAALDVVEHAFVVPAADLQGIFGIVPRTQLVSEQSGDASRTEDLIRHVRSRQNA